MRLPRIKLPDRAVAYHCMSRIVGKQMLLDGFCKDRLVSMIKRQCQFAGVELLTWTVMTNHFHFLVLVPQKREPTDVELLRRMEALYGKTAGIVQLAKEGLGKTGKIPDDIRQRMVSRMGDVSVLMKELKQRFSVWYNRRHDRDGTLWSERFRCTVVEVSSEVLMKVAVYIDLNSVRDARVNDPKEYRHSGYGAAMRGDRRAREGLMKVVGMDDWGKAMGYYRQLLYVRGGRAGRSGKGELGSEEIKGVIRAGGEVEVGEVLRLRIRHMTDGVALGSREFVEEVFRRYRGWFGRRRRSGARRIRGVALVGVYVLRDLRVRGIS